MESETGELVYCELCGYLTLDNLCDHIILDETQQTEDDTYQEKQVSDVSGDTLEELLIALVETRRQLWDSRLPVTKRSKVIRDKLWIEIYEALQRQYTIEFLQKKWRNLRDTYIKKISEVGEYVPSGSAAKTPGKKVWKHYDLLTFLSDTVAPRKTTSNLGSADNMEDKENNRHTPSTANAGRKRFVANSNKVEDAFIDAIQNIKPPKTVQNSEYKVNPICMRISQILDNLEDAKRARLEIDLLTLTYNIAYPAMNN